MVPAMSTAPSSPAVSVVVATHDRPARLERLLDALAAQDLGREAYEVVVVDDASREPTTALLAQRERAGAVRTLRTQEARGPAHARNLGWRAARGALVAFTDDDCVPARGWLTAGLAAHRRAPGAVVQGRTEPDPQDARQAGPFSRTVDIRARSPQLETCNVFYSRELLEALDGFDERFGPTPGGEDVELGWRATEAGRAVVFAPAALVHHAVEHLGPAGALRFATRWAGSVRTFALHPQARVTLHKGLFWNAWHYLLVRSLAALALPRPLRFLLIGRHLWVMRARAARLGAGNRAIPFLLLRDAVETASVLRAAVRHRTPVI